VLEHPGGETVPVVVEIVFEECDPPSGRVAGQGADPVPFVGWLGLLRVISELLTEEQR
jgi:hypothetical protein